VDISWEQIKMLLEKQYTRLFKNVINRLRGSMLSHLIIIQTGHIGMYDGIFITGLWNHGLILYQYGARCKGLVRRLLMLSLVMWIKELKNYSLTKQLCCFFCIWEFFVVFFFCRSKCRVLGDYFPCVCTLRLRRILSLWCVRTRQVYILNRPS